jgi:hydrogenase maturation factor
VVAEVPRNVLETVLFQFENDTLPIEDDEDPIEYVKKQLGIEDPDFKASNISQIIITMHNLKEKEGQRQAAVMNKEISKDSPLPDPVVCMDGNGHIPSGYSPGSYTPTPQINLEALNKIKTVTQEEARMLYLQAKMIKYMVLGEDVDWGEYVMIEAGIPRELIEEDKKRQAQQVQQTQNQYSNETPSGYDRQRY